MVSLVEQVAVGSAAQVRNVWDDSNPLTCLLPCSAPLICFPAQVRSISLGFDSNFQHPSNISCSISSSLSLLIFANPTLARLTQNELLEWSHRGAKGAQIHCWSWSHTQLCTTLPSYNPSREGWLCLAETRS